MKKDDKGKVGRPRLQRSNLAVRQLVTLDPETVAKARRIGEGNVSAGIRVAVGAYKRRSRGDPQRH